MCFGNVYKIKARKQQKTYVVRKFAEFSIFIRKCPKIKADLARLR